MRLGAPGRMDIRLNGNFQSMEVGEELTVSSSQSKDCDLQLLSLYDSN